MCKLKVVKSKQTLKTRFLYLTQNIALYRRVARAAAVFVHVTISTGGIRRLPTHDPDEMTDAFLTLERSIDGLR
jgi:hypothetical protein